MRRRWLWLVGAVALLLTFAQSPGQISPDPKLDLTANPLRFLTRAFDLWNSDLPFGQAQNQAYGYLFPHGTFFLLGDLLEVPGWVTQRLWWALVLTVGFWGVLRVAEALRIGLVTEVVGEQQLWDRAHDIAACIAAKPPTATQGTVKAIWESLDKPYRAAMDQGLIYTRLGNPIAKAELAERPIPKTKPRIR